MKNIVFLALLILSCSNKSSNNIIQDKKLNQSNQIVLIFEKNEPQASLEKKVEILTNSNIKYSEDNSYLEKFLFPKNANKTDTIKINIASESIVLSHVFDKNKVFFYQIKKGDSAVFNYSKGIPILKIKNRPVKKFDLNIESEFKFKKPLDDFDFFVFNKRNRNENEKKQYKQELIKYRIRSKKTIDSLVTIGELSHEISKFQYNRIKFYVINSIKDFDNINNQDLSNDSIISLKTYRFFLRNYALEKLNISKKIRHNETSYDNANAFDEIYKSNLFSKKAKEYLLYNFLRALGDEGKDISSRFSKFEGISNDLLAVNEIKNTYLTDLTKFKQELSKTNFITIKKGVKNLDQIINENKNKVIYIDFWASWCAPCRVAMPFSRKLRSEFKDKNVVFIYVSIDTDFEKWRNASEKERLSDTENNLLSLNYPTATFYKELQLKTIPRYIIYDKRGKLVHQNAPSPESDEIKAELNKYLLE